MPALYKFIKILSFFEFLSLIFANDADGHYVSDIKLPKNNLDSKRLNKSGKSLLSLCRITSLRIVNGRKI